MVSRSTILLLPQSQKLSKWFNGTYSLHIHLPMYLDARRFGQVKAGHEISGLPIGIGYDDCWQCPKFRTRFNYE